jgi:hypothetical protein
MLEMYVLLVDEETTRRDRVKMFFAPNFVCFDFLLPVPLLAAINSLWSRESTGGRRGGSQEATPLLFVFSFLSINLFYCMYVASIEVGHHRDGFFRFCSRSFWFYYVSLISIYLHVHKDGL